MVILVCLSWFCVVVWLLDLLVWCACIEDLLGSGCKISESFNYVLGQVARLAVDWIWTRLKLPSLLFKCPAWPIARIQLKVLQMILQHIADLKQVLLQDCSDIKTTTKSALGVQGSEHKVRNLTSNTLCLDSALALPIQPHGLIWESRNCKVGWMIHAFWSADFVATHSWFVNSVSRFWALVSWVKSSVCWFADLALCSWFLQSVDVSTPCALYYGLAECPMMLAWGSEREQVEVAQGKLAGWGWCNFDGEIHFLGLSDGTFGTIAMSQPLQEVNCTMLVALIPNYKILSYGFLSQVICLLICCPSLMVRDSFTLLMCLHLEHCP